MLNHAAKKERLENNPLPPLYLLLVAIAPRRDAYSSFLADTAAELDLAASVAATFLVSADAFSAAAAWRLAVFLACFAE